MKSKTDGSCRRSALEEPWIAPGLFFCRHHPTRALSVSTHPNVVDLTPDAPFLARFQMNAHEKTPSARKPPKTSFGLLRSLGPGLITGASDDDPSGIGTYSQAGAQLGFSIGWTMLITYPLMTAIQEISARIGRTTGHGIAGNLGRHSPAWLLYSVVGLLFIANTINIGADLGAMGDAVSLLVGGYGGSMWWDLPPCVQRLLAGFRRSGRRTDRPRAEPLVKAPQPSCGRAPAHPDRHAGGHGVIEHHCARDHTDGCGDAA